MPYTYRRQWKGVLMFIYAISCGKDGPIKIGVSFNPAARLRNLQGSNPIKLKLIDMWRVDHATGRLQEGQIHRAIGNRRISNEWFDLTEAEARVVLADFFADRRAERIILGPVIIQF